MTEPEEARLRQALRDLPPPPLPEGLAARILAEATRRPQHQPWPRKLHRALQEWHYAWPLKLASLALCLVLGGLAGHWQGTPADVEMDAAATAMNSLFGDDLP